VAAAAIAATLTGVATPALAVEVAGAEAAGASAQAAATTQEAAQATATTQAAAQATATTQATAPATATEQGAAQGEKDAQVAGYSATGEASGAAAGDASGSAATEPATSASSSDAELVEATGAEAASGASEPTEAVGATEDAATDESQATPARARMSVLAAEEEPQGYVDASIEDGLYGIASAVADDRYLDVRAGDTGNGGVVQTWSGNQSAAQRWRIASAGGGYYTIQNVNSGKYLDVANGSASSGATVQQYEGNGSAAQLWRIVCDPYHTGNYLLFSKLGAGGGEGLALDVSAGSRALGARVQLWAPNGTLAQSFGLSAIRALVEDGVYTITNAGSGKVLDVSGASLDDGGNVQQYSANGTQSQEFQLTYDAQDGYYTVVSAVSGRALDVDGARDANGANVWQYSANGTRAQRWALVSNADDGTYSLVSALGDGRALDVSSASSAGGANVQIYESNGTAAQRWTLARVARAVAEGTYRIVLENNHANALSVSGPTAQDGSAATSAAVSEASLSERWYVSYDGDRVKIVNVASGKALDVASGSTADGTVVQQYADNGTAAQRWYLRLGAGGWQLASALGDGVVLDVSGNSTKAGARIQVWGANGSSAQRFHLVPCDVLASGEIYTIVSLDGSGDLVVDVPGASDADGVALQVYEDNGTAAQRFKVVRLSSGDWQIVNVKSGKYLAASGEKVVQQAADGSDDQLWRVSFDPVANAVRIVAARAAAQAAGEGIKAGGTTSGSALVLGDTSSSKGFLFKAARRQANSATTLDGVDIAMSYDGHFDPYSVAGDFVVIKTTQGTSLQWSDGVGEASSYTSMADRVLDAGKLLGFYHFADAGVSMVEQARAFVDSVKDYLGKAVLFLDWENTGYSDVISLGPSAAKQWLDTVYGLTGVRPLIYMSRSVVNEYDWSPVADAGYGLWCAQYPDMDAQYGYLGSPWMGSSSSFGAWEWPTVSQYSATGRLDNFGGDLDLDKFYGSAEDWLALAARS
jgi:GH25 family lysozyme M1 (1,4-beta-N-acetylmuramidase)